MELRSLLLLLSPPPRGFSSSSSSPLLVSSLPNNLPSSRFSAARSIYGASPHYHRSSSYFPNSSSSSCCRRRRPIAAAAAGAPNTVEEEEEEEDEDVDDLNFIEVGYISKVHGLQGELRVKPTTDFPQLRFSTPGKRWLRTRVCGKDVISEVELTAGRDHPGQNSWIIALRGTHTVDQAKQLVGSTLLVKEGDRPELEEGEFYTSDLVGMSVVLKGSGKLVGVVVNVFNHGANDLLQVVLNSDKEEINHSNLLNAKKSDQLVWVPFVEAIVPEVDLERREMHITPPKGLLELNLRSDMKSKKERRQLVRPSEYITVTQDGFIPALNIEKIYLQA